MKNKISILILIGLIFIIFGVSYSFFNFLSSTNEINTSNGEVYMKLIKGNNNIILDNVFPETYEEASIKDDNYIDFTVIGKNTYKNSVYYEIDLEYGDSVLNKTRIDDKYLKFELLDITDSDNIETIFSGISYNSINNRKIHVDSFNTNLEEITRTYRLRMWYDEIIKISDTEPDAIFRASNLNTEYSNNNLPIYTDIYSSVKVKVYGDFNEKSLYSSDSCFETSINGDNVTITGYDISCGDNVNIPKTINNKTVTIIGQSAFESKSTITNIIIPNTVTKISKKAFYNCTNLNDISIPNSVTIIEDSAFYGCSNFTRLFIPSSVINIGYGITNYCDNLSRILVDSNNTVYYSDNSNSIIVKSTNNLILGCKNTIIPNNVINIESLSFEGCIGLTNIIIPNSVTNISDFAFFYCENLEEITLSKNLTNIGIRAFSNCHRLNNLNLPISITNIDEYAFESCNLLTHIYVKWTNLNNLTIASNSFSNLTLNHINLHVPSNMYSIYSQKEVLELMNIIENS